jgi:hypothetical protein
MVGADTRVRPYHYLFDGNLGCNHKKDASVLELSGALMESLDYWLDYKRRARTTRGMPWKSGIVSIRS